MVIISKISYPPEAAPEIAKRFLEAPPMPDYIVRKGPYVSSNTKDGLDVISIMELDDSRLAEGMKFTSSYHAIFYGVPGFKYEVKPFYEVEEALKILGIG